jgi:hypothetical protein
VDITHEQLGIIPKPSEGDLADFLETDVVENIGCAEKVFAEEGEDEENWNAGPGEREKVRDSCSWGWERNEAGHFQFGLIDQINVRYAGHLISQK